MRGKAEEPSKSALARLEATAERVLVHFDVDAIDLDEFPVADVPHRHGLTVEEARDVLRVLVSSPKFAGLIITEFNSDRDPANVHATALVEAVVGAIANGHEGWEKADM
jgi:arginase